MPNLFKVKRRALGLTQQELADKLNVSDGAVSEWERGKNWPAPGLVPKLARLFKMDPEDLSRELETARLGVTVTTA